MADGDVQGLLVRIEATTAQLRQEMARGESAVAQTAGKIDGSLGKVDQAFDRAGNSAKTLSQAISSAASSFGGFNIAAVGSIAGLAALTSSTIDHAREVKNLSSVSNASVEEFQRMAYGAKSVGIEQDKLGDILKDVNDRVGEFIQRGGGEMADFFTEIAPKVGVTAEQFKNLSGPQALQLYYTSLEKAGLNQQQMTTYMEAMGDESTALIPLLQDNGKGFKEMGDRAEKFGLVISKLNIERLVDAGQAVKDLQSTFSGASQQLVVGLLPGIESVTQGLAKLRDEGGAQKVGETIAFLAQNIDVLAAALGGKLAAAFAKYAIDAVTSAGAATAAFLENVAATKASAIAKADEAAVSAQNSAAKLREAVAAASSTTALQAEAVARVANLQAVRESLGYQAALAVGSAEEAQLKASLAAVEVELTAARKAEVVATQAQAVASTAAAGAMARDTAATQANAAAQAEAAAAKGVLARAGTGLLGLLGGPAGIAALAVGVGVAFLTMGSNARTAVSGMDELKRSTEDVRKSFQELAKDQQRSALVSVMREQESAASAADDAYASFFKVSKQVLGSTVATRIAGDAEQARKAGKGLSDTLDDWQKRFHIPESGMRSLQEAAGALATAEQRTKLLADRQALYRSELDKGSQVTQVNTGLTAEQTLAVNTLQKSMEKQLNTLQDKNAVDVANRLLTDNKISATSKEGQALLATAAAIDKQKAADQAAAKAKSDSNSAAQKAISLSDGQKKALADLEANTRIATSSAQALADAYLNGVDKSRALTIQQKVEQELLKTGAGVRGEVEKAINAQVDAEDRLAVSKQAYTLQKETDDLIAQAKATLGGAHALQAYNVQKAMQVALANRNIEAGSKEYEQLLAATEAQQEAVKIAQQAGSAGSIMDRLYPESKLLKDYTADQEALNAAIALGTEKTPLYQAALVKLGKEYEVNQSKATLWGQMTEGAVDRIDGVFADAWANIGSGADGLWDNLVKGAKQAFGEIAHMLTTKPLLASISNWLTGTDNGQGLGSVWGRLLGDGSGGGSGGGSLTGSIASLGKTVYQLYSAVTGVGSSIASGYASGGFSGAVSGGVNYYGNILSGISDTLSTGFGNLAGAIFGSGASQIAANAATSAALNAGLSQSVTQIGSQFAANVGFEAAGQQLAAGFAQQVAGSAATTGLSAGLMGQLAAMASNPVGWAIAAVTSAYQSGKLYDQGVRWDTKEVMNTDLVKYSAGVGQVMIGQLGLTNDILEKVVGGKLAAIFSGSVFASAMITGISNKIFGGSWVTKDQGIQLGVTAGDLDAYKYTYQKKKGGLFGSNKSRTKLGPLDEEMQTELQSAFDARIDTVFSIFDSLNVDVPEAALDGLNMDAWKISLKDLTSEQVNQMISDFFEVLGNEAVGAISKSMNLGLDTYNVNQLAEFVNNLYSINDTFKLLNVNALPVSVWGGKLAEQYVALAGGLENFSTATQTYYGAFFSDAEKSADTLEAVRKQFADLNITFPGSKEGFRAMVEGIDSTTDAGRTLFLQLMGLAGNASAAYDILAQQAQAAKQTLLDGAGTAFSTLQRSIQAQQKALTDAYNARVSSLNDMMTTATTKVSDLTGVSNDLTSALKQLQGTSDESVKTLRSQAQATLQNALATARAGGSLANFSGLSDALDTIGSNSTDLYASLEDFNRDQGETANVVAELNQLNGRQLTSAQQTVKTLQDQLDQAKKAYDAQTAVFDAQLSFAQSQLDALNGVDNSVKSVADAVKAMNAAVVAALAGLGGMHSTAPDVSAPLIESAYWKVLGRDADSAGLAYWQQQLSSGSISYAQLEQAIRNAAKANGTLPAFASGGLISGPGTGTSDSILARVSNGEYMMSAAAVGAYGTDLLDQMNSLSLPAFAAGGPVVSIPKLGQVSSSSGSSGNDAVGQKLDRLAALLERLVGPVGDIRDNSNKGKQMLDKWDRLGLPSDAEV